MTNKNKYVIINIENEREVTNMEKNVMLEVVCPICGKLSYVSVNIEDYIAWVNGELIQNAFPYLSATRREQLISGFCPSCQTKVFGECA